MSTPTTITHAIRHLSFTVEDRSNEDRRAVMVGQGIDLLLIGADEWAALRAEIDRILGFSRSGAA